jgi:ferredoxin--NADP+ reductase
MLDIVHYLVHDLKVDEVVAVARRGPVEVKFDKAEMEYVAANLDVAALDAELERCRPIMEAVGQDVAKARAYILAAQASAAPKMADTCFRLEFLASPHALVAAPDGQGRVAGLQVEDTTLLASQGDTKARGLGTFRVIAGDTVVFAIGDRVDDSFGLPVQWNAFVKNPEPRFPVGGLSYEAYDPAVGQPIADVFVAGWSREASTGLVGAARKDGTNGAQAVMEYLRSGPTVGETHLAALRQKIERLPKPAVTKEDWQRLEAAEQAQARERGLTEFKYDSNNAMLAAMGFGEPAPGD